MKLMDNKSNSQIARRKTWFGVSVSLLSDSSSIHPDFGLTAGMTPGGITKMQVPTTLSG
ncbi:MAG: hypothetical protein AAF393_00400 [Pseudomonadota bacterium]